VRAAVSPSRFSQEISRMPHATSDVFRPLDIAVLTVSDTRTEATDTSGKLLADKLTEAGHRLADRALLKDDKYQLRARVSAWIADPKVQAIVVTGGTGLTGRDITVEALRPLLDKEIEGFGELFRQLSYEDIRTSTIQSRAFAGLANGTAIFCLPGSTGACRLGWDAIIGHQLDSRHGPCNLVELMPRFLEK
jgi:molybdenum cofactor biosynthesis protein B